MKFYLKLPGEGELRYEVEPLKPEQFEMLCWLAGIWLVGGGLVKLLLAAAAR